MDNDNQDESFSKDQIDDNIRTDLEQWHLQPVTEGKIPPLPGVPEAETLTSISINNNKLKAIKQEGYGEKPEWFKYWNKSIR